MKATVNSQENGVTLTINQSKAPMYKLQLTAEVLGIIAEVQQDCAPITVQIGHSRTGKVEHLGVTIKSAPPCLILRLSREGFFCDVTEEGVYISHKRA